MGLLFTGDAALAALIQPALLILALAQPICGIVFVLDGVLIGAGDVRYLAAAGVLTLAPFLPALALVAALAPAGAVGLAWLGAAFFGVYMLARLATLASACAARRGPSPASERGRGFGSLVPSCGCAAPRPARGDK